MVLHHVQYPKSQRLLRGPFLFSRFWIKPLIPFGSLTETPSDSCRITTISGICPFLRIYVFSTHLCMQLKSRVPILPNKSQARPPVKPFHDRMLLNFSIHRLLEVVPNLGPQCQCHQFPKSRLIDQKFKLSIKPGQLFNTNLERLC